MEQVEIGRRSDRFLTKEHARVHTARLSTYGGPKVSRRQIVLGRCATRKLSIRPRRSNMSILLTNADTMRPIPPVGAAMPALTSEKVFDFREFLGATRRIRTDDLLITNRICYQISNESP